MHYIRFLKQPRLVPAAPPNNANASAKIPNHATCVSAKITITTDLGEFFLFESVLLCASLVVFHPESAQWSAIGSTEVEWTASDGYTGLEVNIPIAGRGTSPGELRMFIQPRDQQYKRDQFEHFGVEKEGGVVSVRSMPIDSIEKGKVFPPLAERVFVTGEKQVHIWEETGESIARHIWDAGLILSSYAASFSQKEEKAISPFPMSRTFVSLLSKPSMKVLELGAGCGIVGITLTQFYHNISKTVLTDLPEASEILNKNISAAALPQLSSCVLDWSLPLPTSISSESWDLILVADCTYNPDVVPHLVRTLETIVSQQRGCVIVLAMKVRHVSELVFFSLMTEAGFVVRDKVRIPLLVLGQEDEEIEIVTFMFGNGDEV